MGDKKITLCDSDLCTACSACENICPENAINMISDDDGFHIPDINYEKCISCGLCVKKCPVITPLHKYDVEPSRVYAAWSNDRKNRMSSSSGGVFGTLARYVIEDLHGIVFGAAYNEDMQLEHISVECTEKLELLKGSKYLQSDIGLTFREVRSFLKQKKYVLFVGTPCQIAGLYSYLGKDSDYLFTCDLVCHGVPSPQLFQKYISYLKNKYKQPVLKNFSFRYLEGWCVRTSFEYKNKIKTLVGIDNFYIKAYLKNYLHRESCYKCRFSKFPRQGDFTLGDFWGIGRETPFIHDVQKGLSLVIVNTPKGQLIFENIKECLFEEERSLDEAVMGNKNLVESSQRPVERDFIYQDLRELSITQVAKKYNLLDSRFFIVKRGYNYLLRLLSRKK